MKSDLTQSAIVRDTLALADGCISAHTPTITVGVFL
jgi:hypothetical protein